MSCRFFPSVYYLSTSKVAIAVLGNLAFALALALYNVTTKVGRKRALDAIGWSAKFSTMYVVCRFSSGLCASPKLKG